MQWTVGFLKQRRESGSHFKNAFLPSFLTNAGNKELIWVAEVERESAQTYLLLKDELFNLASLQNS